jgi:hypothetical protein
MSQEQGYELGWDDPIEKNGLDWVLLPEGIYEFTVVNYERGRYAGGQKLPPCNKAIIDLKIESKEGETTIKHNLFLHSTMEGLIGAFFNAIGLKSDGERFVMNFNAAIGRKGKAKIFIDEWTKNDGTTGQSNKVKNFVKVDKPKFSPGSF